jgi:dipeptide/tripeptide permease
MGIGASVFMLAIGAIITFAFNIRVGWLDLDVVGWVLMAAGALGLILTLTVFNKSRRTVTRTASPTDPYAAPPTGERVVEQRSTSDVDRPL